MTRDLPRWLFAGLFALWAQVCCCQSAAAIVEALDRLADRHVDAVACCSGTVETPGGDESPAPCERCPERRNLGVTSAPEGGAPEPAVQVGVVAWTQADDERAFGAKIVLGRAPPRTKATGPPATLLGLRCALII